MRVFVHLAHGFDVRVWESKWRSGELLGINDPSPYGYHRAAQWGAEVTFSSDHSESGPVRLLRQGVRVLLGFDLVHAWRNRRGLQECDVVWTHTESNYLGVAAALTLALAGRGAHRRPKLIGQSIWLFDKWDRIGAVRRTLYRALISRVDVLTVLSPSNLAIAHKIFPQHRVEFVPFGISVDDVRAVRVRPAPVTLRILSVGNDRHRDWKTLLSTVTALDDVELRIVSRQLKSKALARTRNSTLALPTLNAELIALYEWADLVVVPLKENLHASGITVCEEAAVMGIPVIASDVGGLRSYFDDSAIVFVPPGDSSALCAAITELRSDPALRRSVAESAQKLMGDHGLSSQSFVRAHVRISESLLGASR